MNALFIMHMTATLGAMAIGVVALTRGTKSPLLNAIVFTAFAVAAWNAAQGLSLRDPDSFWRVLSPALSPVPLACFHTLALRASGMREQRRRRREIFGLFVAATLSLLTASAFVSTAIRHFVYSSNWNLALVVVLIFFIISSSLALVRGIRRLDSDGRMLCWSLLIAGLFGFTGGLTQVLPLHAPLQLGALMLIIALTIAAVGVVTRQQADSSFELRELLLTLAFIVAIAMTSALVAWRTQGHPDLAMVLLASVGIVALTAYRSTYHRWQYRLQEATRLAALGKAASVLAHEVRNPLTTVKGVVDILDQELQNVDGMQMAQEYFSVVRGELDRVLLLVDDCLTYTRAPRMMIELFDLGELIERIVGHARLRFNCSIKWQRPEHAILLDGDTSQLGRLLENLVVNACQCTDNPEVAISVVQRGEHGIEVHVEDNGPGVEEAIREKIFEPFFTTKTNGGGLGLAIVREIARRHGGDIKVESKPESGRSGSRFVATWQRSLTQPDPSL